MQGDYTDSCEADEQYRLQPRECQGLQSSEYVKCMGKINFNGAKFVIKNRVFFFTGQEQDTEYK